MLTTYRLFAIILTVVRQLALERRERMDGY